MKLYYKLKEIFLNKHFFIFVIIGIINTIIYNEYYLLGLLVMPYLISSISAYIISMTCSYLLNSTFNYNIKPTLKKYLLFPLSGIPTFLCQTLGLTLFVEVFRINESISGFLCSIVAIPFSFIIMKYILKK